MANRQRGFSHTLPKNFTFPSLCTDEEEPMTPHRASIHLDGPPPPPRPASCRSRRFRVRSGTDVSALADSDFRAAWTQATSDIPVPSIEFPSQHDQDVSSSCAPDESSNIDNDDNDDGYLAPPRGRTALKTPPAQIRATPVDLDPSSSWPTWDHQLASGESIERPGSACSHASDSSISSIDTLASRPSVEGSCTSTESDSHDPFFFGLELPKKPALEAAPVLAPTDEAKTRRRQDGARHKWSMAMDTHLWNTYQMYIQDPTITPFKMTPGSVPPLGVTHRVAREAKRRWNCRASGARKSQQAGDDSATPTPRKISASKKLGWSKSESSTRRRLKLLCREKFSIAPHYQRLMMSKTPEPLTSSPEESAEAYGDSSMAFTTRDLGVSLVSSTAPQPLAQLAADNSQPMEPSHSEENASSQVNPIVARRSLGLDRHSFAPRLGSPFNYHTWGPDRSKRRTRRHSPMGRRETIHVTGGFRLQSPPQMDLFSNINTSNNQPQQEQQQQQVQEPFAEPLPTSELEQIACSQLEKLASQDKTADAGHRRVRIRNRGATTSAVNTRAVQQLFSPPSSTSKNESSPQEKRASKHRRNLSGETIKRLGSPFKMDAPKRPQSSSFASSRTIRHKPSFSDPFISPASGMKPHLSASQTQLQVPGAAGVATAPYDIMEPGLSDAERIRRQIMNMSHSRR